MSTFSDVGQGAGGFFGILSVIAIAARKRIVHRWRLRREFKSRLHDLAYGLDGVEGMSARVPTAVVRIANCEDGIAELKEGQARIEGQLVEVIRLSSAAQLSAGRIEDQVTPNGGKKNTLGDLARRRAEADGTWNPDDDADSRV